MAFTQEEVAAALAAPNGALALMDRAGEALPGAWALFCAGSAPACGFLCACAKKKAHREWIAAQLKRDRAPLYAGLAADAPKLRKNAARLCGALADPVDRDALCAALAREQTRFVRPSLLLALGAVGGAEEVLKAYVVEPGEPKHVQAEQEALRLALQSVRTLPKHVFTGLDKPYTIELAAPEGLADTLSAELRGLGYQTTKVVSGAVRLVSADLPGVYRARCFYAARFPLGRCAADPVAIAALASPVGELLKLWHAGEPPFGYRVECRVLPPAAVAALLDSDLLVNAPANYEAELILEPCEAENGQSTVAVSLRLYTLPDPRFAYRVRPVSAGIHPALAAALLRRALPHLRADARVLDPCCGGGTLLFEREKLLGCKALTGMDISLGAVESARLNAAAAESRARFIQKDCLHFHADHPYEEVVANLPFGNRVGTHEDNERLYAGLLDRLPLWAPGGVAILYTMEHTLLRRLLRARPAFKLLDNLRTEAGGLLPEAFILKIGK